MMLEYLAWPGLESNKMVAMTTISGYASSSRQRMSLGKGIATWTMSVVMQFDWAMFSIGGTCDGDNFN